MKIAFITIPAYGHINPIIALAKELQLNGHDVVIYANQSFKNYIEVNGVACVAHPEIDESNMHLKNAVSSVSKTLTDGIDHALPFLLAELSRDRPDLIIRDIAAFWGKLLEDKLHIRAVVTSPVLLTSALTFLANPSASLVMLRDIATDLPSLVRLQAKLFQTSMEQKLRPYLFSETISAFSSLNLVFTFKEFQPFNHLYTEPKFTFISDLSVQNVSTVDFQFDSQKKKIYVSLGTLFNKDVQLLERILLTLQKDFRDIQVIAACGNEENLERFRDMPPNFIVRKYVAQDKVLDEVDLVIASGGMNTVRDVTNKQVPMIIIPMISEQEFQGSIVEHFKLGKRLSRESVLNSNILSETISQILSNSNEYKKNALKLKLRSQRKSVKDAVQIIEALYEPNPRS